ncbi:putative photosynthetic complex assembly protein PuhE [Roseibacterium sp. SDUM158017]|uniref:putative photosynthetic complex assembly protein PuhE n=1 Tax=Roseicyclus salinarum TaxID=3036773 RepID=UPI0024151432|nr:putative photosynthetic complex assembly protein PuhE [Roseibacterium sp. SDUM158017]MDG4646915.1 putative photosynthetic complex assembly protein PuhE [Roseibacterium sp. SDUM158017]
MMTSPWIAALLALFLWWFSTGAILLTVRRADREGAKARLWAVLWNLPFLVIGGVGFIDTVNNDTVAGVYVAFLSALALWGWIELAFLTGVITGPVRQPLKDGVPEWERFIRAWGTIAYHEMLLAFTLIGMVLLSYGAENQFGTWTFTVLFLARISAKLNLYLGVRKINVEFIPDHLAHLPSHFRIARMNWLFPISITALSVASAFWLGHVFASDAPAHAVGYALLGALTALALLEHWFMVLPLPDERLWRWMLPERPSPNQAILPSEDAR